MNLGFGLDALDVGIARVGGQCARQSGRESRRIQEVTIQQRQLYVRIIGVERRQVEAQFVIEHRALEPELVVRQCLGGKRFHLEGEERPRIDATTLEPGRYLRVGHDVVGPAIVDVRAIVRAAAFEGAGLSIQAADERIAGRSVRIETNVGVVLVFLGVAHPGGKIEFVAQMPDGMQEAGLGVRQYRIVAHEVKTGASQHVPQVLVRAVDGQLSKVVTAEGVVEQPAGAPIQSQLLAELVVREIFPTQSDGLR